jgi:hypothetical protein
MGVGLKAHARSAFPMHKVMHGQDRLLGRISCLDHESYQLTHPKLPEFPINLTQSIEGEKMYISVCLNNWGRATRFSIFLRQSLWQGIFYALRIYSNRIYDEGYRSGKTAATAEMLKAKQAEWKTREVAIAADAKTVADEKLAITAANERLN